MTVRRGRSIGRRRLGLPFAMMCGSLLAVVPAMAQGTADPSHEGLVNRLLVGLLVILVGAKLGGELFQRMRQPAVLGEIVCGILIGNLGLLGVHYLDYLRTDEAIQALSELGVVLLLFEVGLESDLREMRSVGVAALRVAALGVLMSLLLVGGAAWWLLPGRPPMVPLFLAATLCATSVGITARVLRDLGRLQLPEARTVIGAAVIDDVLGLVVLAVAAGMVTALSGGHAMGAADVLLILGKAIAFLVVALVIGCQLSPRLFRLASYLHVQHMLLVTSLGFCFLLARLASAIGLAPIIGAFAAGLILDRVHYPDFRDRGEHSIEELIHPISGFLVPVFFVVAGMHVDLTTVVNPAVWGVAAVLALMAILGKQACALGVWDKGRNRLAVGAGMIPRGEVSLIFANMGLGMKVPSAGGVLVPLITPELFGAVVLVVLVTTVITPSLLKSALARS